MQEKGGYPSQEAAYEAGIIAYAKYKHGGLDTTHKILYRDYFGFWLDEVIKPTVKPATVESYDKTYKNHLQEAFGGTYLQEIRPRDVDLFVRAMAANGLSKNTIKKVLGVLRASLNYAVYPAEVLASNPASRIKIPASAPGEKVHRTVLSREQFAALIAEVSSNPHKAYAALPICLGYYAGLRIGEALGLEWSDVSLDQRQISIKRQVKSYERRLIPPKTASGRRTISISPKLVAILRDWHARQTRDRLSLGRAYQHVYELPDGQLCILPGTAPAPEGGKEIHLVCVDCYGVPLCRTRVETRLRANHINFHSLRHTHATRLIEAGARPVDVAARLGHASVVTTEAVYTHDTAEMQAETARLIDKCL